jgi:hypothetical protein
MTPKEVDKLAEQIAQEFMKTISRAVTYDEYSLIVDKLKKMGYAILESVLQKRNSSYCECSIPRQVYYMISHFLCSVCNKPIKLE